MKRKHTGFPEYIESELRKLREVYRPLKSWENIENSLRITLTELVEKIIENKEKLVNEYGYIVESKK